MAPELPAQNEDAEKGVLGAMMVSAAAVEPVLSTGLTADDFYRARHQTIFKAIERLVSRRTVLDSLIVVHELEAAGKIGDAGGRDFILDLASRVPVPAHADEYARIVQQAARLRRKREIGLHLRNGLPPDEAIEQLQLLADPQHGLCARPAEIARVRPTRWLWERRVPLGYLSLLVGAEGVGKGTLSAWLIAQLTLGTLHGHLAGQPARVLYIGDEDSFDSVVTPRLYAACADLNYIDTLGDRDDGGFNLRHDSSRLRDLLEQGGYKLLFVDALLDILGADVDDWRSKSVRDALRPLRRVVKDIDVAVLAALHPNKGQRSSFRDLMSGSHAFNASSRSSLLLASHPDDENRRVLVRGKGNLSAEPPAFEFAVQARELEVNGYGFDLPVLADEHESELSVEDIVGSDRQAPVKDALAEQIDEIGTGKVQSRTEIAKAVGRKPDDRSVGRALDELDEAGRWEKLGRGKWRRLGIGTSNEVPMANTGVGLLEGESAA